MRPEGNAWKLPLASGVMLGASFYLPWLVFNLVALQFISLGLIAELVVAGRRPEEEFRIARRV